MMNLFVTWSSRSWVIDVLFLDWGGFTVNGRQMSLGCDK